MSTSSTRTGYSPTASGVPAKVMDESEALKDAFMPDFGSRVIFVLPLSTSTSDFESSFQAEALGSSPSSVTWA